MIRKTIENINITGTSSDGRAVARINEQVVFVQDAIPGDIGDIMIYKKKKSFMEGRLIKITTPSIDRVLPFCEHFGICGGCKWQNMSYEAQLTFKQLQVEDALKRLAKIKLPEISKIIPSPSTKYYRNKLEFTFSNNRWLTIEEMQDESIKNKNALGFHTPQSFSKVIDIKHCHLQPDPSNEIRLSVKQFALENSLTFFDLKQQTGLLRNLIIRTSNAG